MIHTIAKTTTPLSHRTVEDTGSAVHLSTGESMIAQRHDNYQPVLRSNARLFDSQVPMHLLHFSTPCIPVEYFASTHAHLICIGTPKVFFADDLPADTPRRMQCNKYACYGAHIAPSTLFVTLLLSRHIVREMGARPVRNA